MIIAFCEYKGAIFGVRVFSVINDHFTGQFQIKIGVNSHLGLGSASNKGEGQVQIGVTSF